jgi:hypothetical protein
VRHACTMKLEQGNAGQTLVNYAWPTILAAELVGLLPCQRNRSSRLATPTLCFSLLCAAHGTNCPSGLKKK